MSDAKLPAPVQAAPPTQLSRKALMRELVVFQVKLFVDGMKDFVLGPISVIAGLLDLARATPPSEGLFYAVLRSGARFDRWVGLFDAVERPRPEPERSLPASPDAPAPPQAASLEAQLEQLERLVIERHQHSALTAEAKRSLDRVLGLLANTRGAQGGQGGQR